MLSKLQTRKVSWKKCAAVSCSAKGAETKVFYFPNGISERCLQRRKIWAEVAGRPDLAESRKEAYLCAKHFLRSEFTNDTRLKLLSTAVPSKTAHCHSESSDTPLLTTNIQSNAPIQRTQNPSPPHLSGPSHISTYPETSAPAHTSPTDAPIISTDTFSLSPLPTTSYIHNPLTFLRPAIDQPSTSTPKPFQPIQLFEPLSSTSNFSESDSDLLAVPLDSSESLNENVFADVSVDMTPASTSEPKRKRRSIELSQINVSRVRDLTPRKKFLHGAFRQQRTAYLRLQRKYREKSLSLQRLLKGLRGDTHELVTMLARTMTPICAQLLASQVGRSQRQPNGFRWSVNEKLLALKLYKRSPKCYTLLRSILTLPSKSTLINLLNRVPLCTGVNSVIFESLAKSISKYSEQDRICFLMFDEMAIRGHVQYDPRSDRILGFEDLGGVVHSSGGIANQALVFMAKGLRCKWKQPVGYFFNSNGVNGQVISILLKEVLRACRDAGLRVIATVCDMGSKNIGALKALGATYDKPFFTFNDQEVVTLYDPPHLLKCARNMLFNHDVLLNVKIGKEDMQVMRASWNHIREAVMLQKDEPYSTLHKISGIHLAPTNFSKMRVSHAAHVMSNSMAATLYNMVLAGKLPRDAQATARMTSVINNTFDSLNGHSEVPDGPGGLRKQVHINSESLHLNHWNSAIDEIDSWQCLLKPRALENEANPKITRIVSQNGWLATLRGMKLIWAKLKGEGFRYLRTRDLNQDPLEHLFGCIRSNCGSNDNPTVSQFEAALKTAIVNGLAFKEARGANCEGEVEAGVPLDRLLDFLSAEPESHDDGEPSPVIHEIPIPPLDSMVEDIADAVAYVSGYIARRLLQGSNCNSCKGLLTSSTVEDFHSGISAREYSPSVDCLTYPSKELCKTVGDGASLLEKMMPDVAHLPGVRNRLTDAIKDTVNFDWIGEKCVDHQVPIINGIVQGICAISIPWWCKKKNRLLTVKKK